MISASLQRAASSADQTATPRPDLIRLTALAIYVLLAFLFVEVLFESWVQIILADRINDAHGNTVLLSVPDWPKLFKNGAYIALALVTVSHVVVRRTVHEFTTRADVALAVLVTVMVVAGLLGGSSLVLTGEGIYVYLRGVIVFYAVRALDPPWSRAKALLWLVGAVVTLNALISVLQVFIGEQSYVALGWVDMSWAATNRAHALQEHPNDLGHIVGLMMLGLLAWLVTARGVKVRWWLVFGLLALGLAATQSRESLAGVTFGIGALAVLRRGRLKKFAAAVAAVVAFTGVVWSAHPGNWAELNNRLAGVISAFQVPSGSEAGIVCDPSKSTCTIQGLPKREVRILYIQQGVKLWIDRPFFGYGVGQFGGFVAYRHDPQWYLDPRFGPGGFDMHGFNAKQVDSFWLHLLVEVGAVGSIAYLTWYALLGWPCVCAAALRLRRERRGKPADLYLVQPAVLWAPAALVFGGVVAALSPALEDPLFPPLMFGIVGLGWVLARRGPAASPDYGAVIRHARSVAPLPETAGARVSPRPSKQVRILAVTNQFPEEGSYRGIYVQQLVDMLRQLGHHVDVEVVAQSRGKLDYLFAAPRVRRRAREGRYDVVHIHYGMTALAGRFAGSIPRVLSLYGSDVNLRWKRWITKLGWGGSVARIYVSKRLAAKAGDAAGHVIANGVDFAIFARGDREAARAELGFGPDDKVVLFGGDPGKTLKGYAVFSEVLAALKDRGVQVSELILSAPHQATSQVVAKLDAADVLLFTSRRGSEGSPSVVKEATVMGLPVVSVDVGDVGEVLADVTPSAVVPFPEGTDSAQNGAELVKMLADRTADILAKGQRANGRERRAWLDSRAAAQRVLDIYQQVLDR